MIIDAHAHIGRFNSWPLAEAGPDRVVEMLKREGVSYALTSAAKSIAYHCPEGNAEVLLAAKKHKEILPLLCVNPRYPREAMEQLEGCRAKGFVGVKLHPSRQQYSLQAPEAAPVLDYCEKNGIAVLTHSAETDPKCGPAAIEFVARTYPKLQLVVGHACLFSSRRVVSIAEECPNLFLELSVNYEAAKLEDSFQRLGADRLLFGSDVPLHNPSVMVQRIRVMGLSKEDEEKILSGNAVRVFGLGDKVAV